YLNGILRSETLTVSATDLPTADSTLRMGRRTNGQVVNSGYEPQFYGFVDDVAVFNKALSQRALWDMFSAQRLNGNESGLLAGWTFDELAPSGDPLPAVLTKYPINFLSLTPGLKPSGRTVISGNRNHTQDRKKLPLPFQQKTMRLPFPPGEARYVGYGNSA